jgi:hypothetical protein
MLLAAFYLCLCVFVPLFFLDLWRRLWRSRPSPGNERASQVRLAMPEWHYEGMLQGGMRAWRDDHGNVLSLVVAYHDLGLPPLSDEIALQHFARSHAESAGGGLIEVRVATGPLGPTFAMIYKRLLMPAYAYTGALFALRAEPPQVWTIVAGECGTTGVREAIITAELFNAGSMTIDDYKRSWAKDPYDSEYHGVDRSVLRFVSDDESYDERFPQHPLTKVRQVLAALPTSIDIKPTGVEA